MTPQDTIAAISTPPGTGGVALIRVSGPLALQTAAQLWQGRNLMAMRAGSAAHGYLAKDGEIIDEVVLTKFVAPHSFTGEDTVEICCHGSVYIQKRILETLCDAGARPATAGEFTQRAFINGRIDLAQAEGIADLIAAGSVAAHRLAMKQTRGEYSRALEDLRQRMIKLAALLELELDFSEEDVEFADRSQLSALTAEVSALTRHLAESYRVGNAIRNGIPTAIAGIPNAGKSTLLNALLRDDRAIVSDIAGTTRDTVEELITIGGHTLRLIDTAGIRDTADPIETLGIERSNRAIENADIILWLLDPTADLAPQLEQLRTVENRLLPHQTLLRILTKKDLCPTSSTPLLSSLESHPSESENLLASAEPTAPNTLSINATDPENIHLVEINAKDPQDIHLVERELAEIASRGVTNETDIIVTNARHYAALKSATENLDRFQAGLATHLSADFLAQDLRQAISDLGTITGAITTPAILQSIFSSFCIGK